MNELVKLPMLMQATLKAEAATERDRITKQCADVAQQTIITQQAKFDAEMGIMKNRLAQENVSQSEFCACCCAAVHFWGSINVDCHSE